jgi:hypothetical protein
MKKHASQFALYALLAACAVGCDRIVSPRESAVQAGVESQNVELASKIENVTAPSATREATSEVTAQRSDPSENSVPEKGASEILEEWKAKAVAEFPELGIAGSKFNKAFLAEVKGLKERNSAEMAVPNWPYIVALQVNTQLEREKLMAELSAKKSENARATSESSRAQGLGQTSVRAVDNSGVAAGEFGSYRVSELKTMQVAPKGGKFSGVITKIEKPLSLGALEIAITLDGFLPCEINLDRNKSSATRSSNGFYPYYYYYSFYPSSSRSNSSLRLMIEPNQSSAKLVEVINSSAQSAYSGRVYSDIARKDLLTLRAGQAVVVEGVVLIKANKKPMLKGILASQ